MIDRSWLLVEVAEDDDTHAAPSDGTVTFCGLPVMFPRGGRKAPTCTPCGDAVGWKAEETP